MARSSRFMQYPDDFFILAEALAQARASHTNRFFVIPCPNEASARSWRQSWYNFHRACDARVRGSVKTFDTAEQEQAKRFAPALAAYEVLVKTRAEMETPTFSEYLATISADDLTNMWEAAQVPDYLRLPTSTYYVVIRNRNLSMLGRLASFAANRELDALLKGGKPPSPTPAPEPHPTTTPDTSLTQAAPHSRFPSPQARAQHKLMLKMGYVQPECDEDHLLLQEPD